MKNQYNVMKIFRNVLVIIFLFPLIICWGPKSIYINLMPQNYLSETYVLTLLATFRGLCITLVATLLFSITVSIVMGFLCVFSKKLGTIVFSFLKAIESVPSILIALFCYAPVSGFLIKFSNNISSFISLCVFVLAASVTVLPESIRSIAFPLADLYDRKYSIAFRSYGFTKKNILISLMKSNFMKETIRRVAAGILLKTLVLDTSFGYVIQVGLGSTGIPQHISAGALIAANRKELLFGGNNPQLFWIPAILLIIISISFLICLNRTEEKL